MKIKEDNSKHLSELKEYKSIGKWTQNIQINSLTK
jgi:hypothetical protein